MADEQQSKQPEQELEQRGQGTVVGALILAILGSFLAFFAVVLATLLGLVLTTRDTALWVTPLRSVIVQVAAPLALVVFFITLVLMLRKFRQS